MELKPGYKQTEVGEIPQEWEVATLGKLIEYTKGYAFKSSEYSSHGVRVIRVSDTSYDSILEENPVYVPEGKASHYAKWRLRTDDLVISTVGSKPPMYDSMVGKVILISKQNEGALLNQNAVLLRDKKRRTHFQQVILNHLRTKRYLKWVESIFRGNANQASITLKEIFEFIIFFPAADAEQRAIAEALSDADALLAKLDALIAKKRDLKQAAMQQLLTGQTRLPGFENNKGFLKTEVGVIPVDWGVSAFGDLFSITAGGDVDLKRSKSYRDEIHCHPIYSNALTNFGLYGYCSYANHPAGSITITARGTLGFSNFRDHPYSAIGRVLVLRPKKELSGRFFTEVINNRVKFAIESTGVPQLLELAKHQHDY